MSITGTSPDAERRNVFMRVLAALFVLPLSGCDQLATALAATILAGFLLSCLLLLLALFVMAVLPLVRKPATDDLPDFHAPSGPSGLGVGSLVLSGMVAWAIFVPLGYTSAHALLGRHALLMLAAALVLHLFTLALALFASTQQPLDEDDANAKQRMRRVGIAIAVLYAVAMLCVGLWPWLVPT